MNENAVVTVSHNVYKDVLLNNNCVTHSLNRIQIKDHRIGTYTIRKNSLPCFDNKMYIQNDECDELALGYQS